mmetsp:Transcript_18435/g.38382  ORF Transcript_18435/g.38382 Transcript_18435/m.38382 type:complete len:306 (+) Transcript_18435:1764-2681(+)
MYSSFIWMSSLSLLLLSDSLSRRLSSSSMWACMWPISSSWADLSWAMSLKVACPPCSPPCFPGLRGSPPSEASTNSPDRLLVLRWSIEALLVLDLTPLDSPPGKEVVEVPLFMKKSLSLSSFCCSSSLCSRASLNLASALPPPCCMLFLWLLLPPGTSGGSSPLSMASWWVSSLILLLYCLRRVFSSTISFFLALFLIVLQSCPNLRVETVSSWCIGAAVTVQRMEVRVLPPRLFLRMRVSLLSLKGMKTVFPPFPPFLALSPSLLMTAPRARRLLLMLLPSLSWFPVAPVLFCLSEPARSTRLR